MRDQEPSASFTREANSLTFGGEDDGAGVTLEGRLQMRARPRIVSAK